VEIEIASSRKAPRNDRNELPQRVSSLRAKRSNLLLWTSLIGEQMSEILVSAILEKGSVSISTREVLGLARRIVGETGGSVAAVLLGGKVSSFVPELAASGADKVYLCSQEALSEFHPNIYLKVFETIVATARPDLIVFPRGEIGLDIAARLAHRVDAGLVTDCVHVEIQDGFLCFVKPVYGGKALARLRINTSVALITVRPRTQQPFPRDPGRKAQVITVQPPIELVPDAVLVNRTEEEEEEVGLADARVIVSGGRGLEGPEAFKELKKMAKLLGGAAGATRPIVDAGWIPPSQQIGQTGHVVAPELYFAVGLSGSSQHLAGMSGSKVIVAINVDPEAPIFNVATLGVVDDYRKVIPTLIAELEKSLSR
jgi:electron transfer flavoprotein alpha subunit